MEIQGRGRCPSAVDYDGADWRFSFDTHPLTAALAITDELSNTDITRILRRLAATLGVFNAKTPSFNAMRAVLSQLSSPHTHLTNEDVCLAWNAKPSNFGTWKKGILALRATIPLAPPPTSTHPTPAAAQPVVPVPQPLLAEPTVPVLPPPQPFLAELQPLLDEPTLPALILPQPPPAAPQPLLVGHPLPVLLSLQPLLAEPTLPASASSIIPPPMHIPPLVLSSSLLQSQPDFAIDTVQIEEFVFRSQSSLAQNWVLKRKVHQCADILTEMLMRKHTYPPSTKVAHCADTLAVLLMRKHVDPSTRGNASSSRLASSSSAPAASSSHWPTTFSPASSSIAGASSSSHWPPLPRPPLPPLLCSRCNHQLPVEFFGLGRCPSCIAHDHPL
jgi:hypothetical protein